MPPYSADSEAIAEYISGTQKSSAEHSINLEDTLQDHPERMVARCHKYKIDYIAQCELCAHLTHEFFGYPRGKAEG